MKQFQNCNNKWYTIFRMCVVYHLSNLIFMKKLICGVVLSLFFLSTYAQDRGIGVRLGNPMGVTYKKYFPRLHKAVEFGIGTGYSSWYPHYYENSFNHLDRYEGYDYV